jgi:hypothetical protein
MLMASPFVNTAGKKMYSIHITVDSVPCYYEDLGNKEGGFVSEPVLVTGLLGAIATMVREITRNGVLRKIESPPVKFFVRQVMESPQVIMSMFTDIDFPDHLCDIILGEIAEFFLDRYAGTMISWSGRNLTIELSPYVKKIIQQSLVLV